MKLENLLFASNPEFFATMPVGVGIGWHQWFDLAFHLVHQTPINEIRHPQLSVIFLVYTPSKNLILKTTQSIEQYDQKLGVFLLNKGGPYGLHIKKNLLSNK